MVVFAGDDALERADGVFQRDEFAVGTGELLGHEEGLRQEALDLAGARDDQLVLFRQLIHAEDGDDVLQGLVLLQDFLDRTGDAVVLFADDQRVHDPRGRVERVHGREDGLGGDVAAQHGRRVQVGEGGGRGRVGQVVGGDVDGLDRGDRALLGRGDALLQVAHLGRQRRLIANGGRDTAQQGGHFRTGLREAEDVVDEQQNVLAFLVAEILGLGQAGQGDAGAGTGRLVHLAVDEGAFRAFGRAVVLGRVHVHIGLDHLVIEVVALAGALTHAGQNRITAVGLGDVVDQFLHGHGLAHAGAAEQADLAALGIGAHQVDDLDAGDEDFRRGRLLFERRRLAVDRAVHRGLDRALLVDRRADDVHDPAEGAGSDRGQDGSAGVGHGLAARRAFRRVHGDGADHVLAEVLGDFQHQGEGLAGLLVDVLRLQGVQDRRQLAGELDVDDGADDLGDPAHAGAGRIGGIAGRGGGFGGLGSSRLLGGGFLGGGVGHRFVPFGRSCLACSWAYLGGVRIRGLRRPR